MEQTLKKKTKPLIALRTNNYIQTQIEKQIFFNEVLEALEDNFNPKQFQFMTTYLLSQQKHAQKRNKMSFRNSIQHRIRTLADERNFNLSEIDPNLFQQNTIRPNQNLIKKTSIKTKQLDVYCTTTPKRITKEIVFQNKKILDLDKKLHKKYQQSKDQLVLEPHFLLLQDKKVKKDKKFMLKTSYKGSFCNKNNSKSKFTIFRTDYSCSKYQKNSPWNLGSSTLKNTNLRQSQMNFTQRYSEKQNFIPKNLINQVLFKRRENASFEINKDFSDFKLNPSYRECFFRF